MPTDAPEALALFDRLPAVEPTELLGRWRGGSFATGRKGWPQAAS